MYSILIYWFTGLVVWVSIIATGVAMVFLGLWLQKYHDSKFIGAGVDEKKLQQGKFLQAGIYTLYGFVVIYFMVLICLWKTVSVSIGVLKCSASVIFKNIRILTVPLFSAVVLVLWVSFWVASFTFLLASG